MAFPVTALVPRVRIAPGADPAGNPGDWTFVDITSDVRIADGGGITIEVGRADEGKKVDSGKASLIVNNKGGHYSPRCAVGRWSGLLAKNTPIEVTIPHSPADTFARTVASGWGRADGGQVWNSWFVSATSSVSPGAGKFVVNAASSYGMAYLSVLSTDVDMSATVTTTTGVPTGGPLEPLNFAVRVQDQSTYYLMRSTVETTGAIKAIIFDPKGTVIASTTVAGLTWTAGMRLAGRANATGSSLSFKVWDAAGAEPAAWTLSVVDKAYVGVGGIGIRSGVGAGYTGGLPVTFSYTSFSASLWAERFSGTVPEWPPRWDKSGKDAWVPIQAAGVLRRIGTGASPLRSVIYRGILATNPVAYWSLEDQAAASSFAEANGGQPLTYSGTPPTRASGGPPGSAPCITLAADTTLTGTVPAYTKTLNEAGVQFNWKMPDAGGQDYPILDIYMDGDIPHIAFMYGFNQGASPLLWWRCWKPDGTYVDGAYTSIAALVADGKIQGHDVMTGLHVYPSSTAGQLTADGAFFSPDFPDRQARIIPAVSVPGANVGRVTLVQVKGGNGYPRNGWVYGHIGVWPGDTAQAWGSMDGNAGESANSRIIRLAREEGVQIVTDPFQYISQAMGPQPIADFLDILRECETTDTSVLYERGYGLAIQPRTYRHSAPVAMVFDFAAGDVSEPPEPTDDDQALRNDVTVSRKGGTSARAQITTGPNRISLVGRYDDSVDLSLDKDAQTADQAWWRAHLGTVDEVRWPRLPINLAARPGLIPQWLACRPGARINVGNPPPESGAGSTLDLFVEGYAEHISAYDWSIVANCSPASPWYVFVLDVDRLDSDASSVLTAGISATATTFQVSTSATPGAAWTTDPAEWSNGKTLYIEVSGEQMQVTNIAGTTSPQTFTVTRSINGVVKAQKAGDHVGLWKPRVLAL